MPVPDKRRGLLANCDGSVNRAARGRAVGATHGPWALGVACGLLVALAGYLSTTARPQATAAAVEQPG